MAGLGLGSLTIGTGPAGKRASASPFSPMRGENATTKCRIVVFGIDGLSYDAAMYLRRMGAPAISTLYPPMYALSGGGASQTEPGWADIWSGLPSLIHNTYANGMYGQMPDRAHLMVRLIDRYAGNDFFAGWLTGKPVRGQEEGTPHYELYTRINEDGCPGFCENSTYRSDIKIYDIATGIIAEAATYDNFCLFIHFANPDKTGHATESWDSYLEAAWEVDTYVSYLMENLPDDTDIIYCSDHGFNFTERGKVENNHNYAPDGMFTCNFAHTRYNYITRQTIGRTIYRLGNEDPDFVVGGLGTYALYGIDII